MDQKSDGGNRSYFIHKYVIQNKSRQQHLLQNTDISTSLKQIFKHAYRLKLYYRGYAFSAPL